MTDDLAEILCRRIRQTKEAMKRAIEGELWRAAEFSERRRKKRRGYHGPHPRMKRLRRKGAIL